jgi:hypothetical protein
VGRRRAVYVCAQVAEADWQALKARAERWAKTKDVGEGGPSRGSRDG